MKKLEMGARSICWLLWMMLYVLIAAWVGEGLWANNSARFAAAIGGSFWAFVGAGVIELSGLPHKITAAMMEDD